MLDRARFLIVSEVSEVMHKPVPAIEDAAQQAKWPVLKPNEAMFREAIGRGRRIGMLATFAPSVLTMTEEFEQFVGEAYLDSRFDFSYYYPTEASWSRGDREVLCVIYDPAGPVTGSLEGVTD